MTARTTAPAFLLLVSLIVTSSLWAAPVAAEDPSSYFGGSGSNQGYLAWWKRQAAHYDKTAFLESTTLPGHGVALHWTINANTGTIRLAVVAKATGWVGFGLGESGSMLGADMILYSAERHELVDSYVLDAAVMPYRDDCQSWTLLNDNNDDDAFMRQTMLDDGYIYFEATRLLDSADNAQDRVIANDADPLRPPTRVLAAWGDSVEPTHHGPHDTARGAIRFFGDTSAADERLAFATVMEDEAEYNVTLTAHNFVVPTDRTTYQDFCWSRDDLMRLGVDLDRDWHTIGIEPIIQSSTQHLVHHFVVSASTQPWNASLPCSDYPDYETAYVWAPGDVPFLLPSNVGSPLGGKSGSASASGGGGFQSFQLEIHYDNPLGVANMSDNSGIRLYYTSRKRHYDMGVFSTADPYMTLKGRVVNAYSTDGNGLSQHVFDCDGSCTNMHLSQPVTVLREHLHMHQTGVSISNAQIRNGNVIHTGQVEYWDFAQQGNLAVAQPSFTIEPGDSFRTVCNYHTRHNETWGMGSDNEMCMTFLYYYPRQVVSSNGIDLPLMCGLGIGDFLPHCEATYAATPDFGDSQLGRVFGSSSSDSNMASSADTCLVASSTDHGSSNNDIASLGSAVNADAASSGATAGPMWLLHAALAANLVILASWW